MCTCVAVGVRVSRGLRSVVSDVCMFRISFVCVVLLRSCGCVLVHDGKQAGMYCRIVRALFACFGAGKRTMNYPSISPQVCGCVQMAKAHKPSPRTQFCLEHAVENHECQLTRTLVWGVRLLVFTSVSLPNTVLTGRQMRSSDHDRYFGC